uniref:Uncharacterized protein n=1 Tax=Panagrolaimus davidi TaxID=227884 RepID=A0A914PG33_9BILA
MNGTLEFDKIIIYPKGSHKAMVRDIWLTRSEWAPRDFMFHDLEQFKITNNVEKLEKNPIWSYFPNPFLSDAIFHSSLCQMPDGLSCWKYDSTLIKNDTYIDKILQQRADEIKRQYIDTINSIKSSKAFL